MSKTRYFKNLLLLIFCGEAIFFLPFVLVRIFRPTVLNVFQLDNTDLGYAFSVYGISALVSYFFGGILSDKYPAKNLIAIALLITASLGWILSYIPSYSWFVFVYGLWGVSTILLFWSPLQKAIRILGGKADQGKTFGGAEAGRGLTAALLGSLMLLWFSDLELDGAKIVLQQIYRSTSVFIVLLAVLIYFFLDVEGKEKNKPKITWNQVIQVLKIRAVWQQMLFVLCAYVAYKCTDDFSLYAYDIMKFDDAKSGLVATLSLYMRPIAAVSLGFLADRYSVKKMSLWGFGFAVFGSLGFFLFDLSVWIYAFAMNLTVLSFGIFSLRGLYFAIMEESGIPLKYTGTAVGVVSIIGYTPDIFMGPILGYFLDTFPGLQGHQYLFGFCSVFLIIGFINLWFYPTAKK